MIFPYESSNPPLSQPDVDFDRRRRAERDWCRIAGSDDLSRRDARLTRDHRTGLSKAFLDPEARCSFGLRTIGVSDHQIIFPRLALHDLLGQEGCVSGCEIVERYAYPPNGMRAVENWR